MAGEQFHGPQAVAQVLGDQQLAQQLQASEGGGARVVLAGAVARAEARPNGVRQGAATT
jgi:hypothetical protein